MTKYGDNKCLECKENRRCYMQAVGCEQYGVEFICPKDETMEQENERLHNIIEELERWLKSKIDYFDKTAKDTILHEQMTIRVIYDYLQELKGDSSND